ncbi:MAG: transposase [Azospirillaceae bacterium]
MATTATGKAGSGLLRREFDRSVEVAIPGSSIGSDGGLLQHREPDDALGPTDRAAGPLADERTGRNRRHPLDGVPRQSIFSRLAGGEGVSDAVRLCRDPLMCQFMGGSAVKRGAASAGATGRFETETPTRPEKPGALSDLPGR